MPYSSSTPLRWLAAQCLRFLLLSSLVSTATAAELDLGPLAALEPQDGLLLDHRPAAAGERLYPLGPLRRIGGTLRMEDRLQVHGTLTSSTWELPPERNAREAFKVARQALRSPTTQVLFWCEGRDCGESNLWSNDIFANTRLLGSDDQQAFVLVREAEGDTDTLVAVYCVLRGNRRVALHAETFTPQAPLGPVLPTSGTLLRELRDAGELAFPDLAIPPAADWVTLLGRTLNLDSTLRVRLDGPSADQWLAALVAAGVRANRLSLGPTEGNGLHMEIVR
jgi:hypothetical protein